MDDRSLPVASPARLGVFAKYWQPGVVKTRLAADIGPVAASRLHRWFVATVLQRFAEFDAERLLVCWPAERIDQFAPLAGDRWALAVQRAGDLGNRLQQFFAESFEAGAKRVVVIGSDSPTLPVAYVRQAMDALEHRHTVVGPTADGGYYLIGAAGRVPPVFDGVDWGTGRVWQQTMEQVRRAGLSCCVLPPWYDVDRLGDLQRLAAELSQLKHQCEIWNRLARVVDRILSWLEADGT